MAGCSHGNDDPIGDQRLEGDGHGVYLSLGGLG